MFKAALDDGNELVSKLLVGFLLLAYSLVFSRLFGLGDVLEERDMANCGALGINDVYGS